MSEVNWGNYTEAYKAIHDAIHGIRTSNNISITRNEAGYVTAILVTQGSVTKTITITRDPSNFITEISENIS
jgi:transcriptional regulatory protein LevR